MRDNVKSEKWTRTGLAISTALDLIRTAFRTSRLGAPALLASYADLWRLHRSYPDKRISRLPKPTSPDSSSSARASNAVDKADIVIPIYNNFDDTKALLEQLRHEAADHRSIILVNDCSTDTRISPMLAGYCKNVAEAVLIENERNLGFVKTCNRGIETAASDVVILNTDIELPRGAVARIIARLRSADDIATVTPFSNSAYGVGFPDLIHYNERPFQASTDEIDKAFQTTLSSLAPIDLPRGVGFCMAMSRTVIDRIGPFSLDYRQGYGEEADFCMRACKQGFRSVIAPDAYVYHKGGQSFGGTWQKKARAGQLRFLSRHPVYVNMMREYLDSGEAQATGFIALVALSRSLSGRGPRVATVGHISNSPELPKDEPVILVMNSNGKIDVCLAMMGERHQFGFADNAVTREAFQRVQVPFPFD